MLILYCDWIRNIFVLASQFTHVDLIKKYQMRRNCKQQQGINLFQACLAKVAILNFVARAFK